MTTAGPREHTELLARLDAIEQAQSKPHPLWKNTALVGLIGTMVAVVPPSLTAIREYYQTEREVRLSLAKYRHERTLSYLDRALSPETEEAKQAQVFRFLSHLPEDDPVRQWAIDELALVQETIAGLKRQIAANDLQLQQLELEKKATLGQAAAALGSSTPTPDFDPVVQVAQLEVAGYDHTIERLQEQTQSLKVRAGTAPAARAVAEPSFGDDELAPSDGLPLRPSQWRLQVATESGLAEAQRKAALARDAGGSDPVIYRKGSLFYVMVGRYGSIAEARTNVRDYVGGGARPVDLMRWCSSRKPREGYTECLP